MANVARADNKLPLAKGGQGGFERMQHATDVGWTKRSESTNLAAPQSGDSQALRALSCPYEDGDAALQTGHRESSSGLRA